MNDLLLATVLSSSELVLVSLSFAVLFRATRVFHISHGASYLAGGYTALALSDVTLHPLGLVAGGLLGGCVFGSLYEYLVANPLRERGSVAMVGFLGSAAIYSVSENVAAIIFGRDSKVVLLEGQVPQWLSGTKLTFTQCSVIASAIVLSALFLAALRFSRLGLLVRALNTNSELVPLTGVSVRRLQLIIAASAASVAGAAGSLALIDLSIRPAVGLRALLPGVAATLIAGHRRLVWVVAAAILIGATRQGVSYFVSSTWSELMLYCLLFVVLCWRARQDGLQ